MEIVCAQKRQNAYSSIISSLLLSHGGLRNICPVSSIRVKMTIRPCTSIAYAKRRFYVAFEFATRKCLIELITEKRTGRKYYIDTILLSPLTSVCTVRILRRCFELI